jgi:hypothetical protein
MLVALEEMTGPHLKVLARNPKLLKEPSRRKALLEAKKMEDVYRRISVEDEKFK